MRGLFMPLPSGIKYAVRDVEQEKNGNYTVTLSVADGQDAGAAGGSLSKESCRAIDKALAPGFVNVGLVRLLVPESSGDVADLSKGQVVTSGDWIITVVISSDGRIRPDKYVMRSEAEIDSLNGGGN